MLASKSVSAPAKPPEPKPKRKPAAPSRLFLQETICHPSSVLEPDQRFPGDGGLLDFAKWLYPTFKWVDRIHRPIAECYERHLAHVIKWRGKRAEGESHRITLIETPRFSLKTTLMQAFCLWAIPRCPNIRIAITTKAEDLAKKSLGAIKRTMEGDPRYIERFGKLKPDSKNQDLRLAWAADGIIVATRTDHHLRERTVECVGVGAINPGYHFDISWWDDPHGDEGGDQYDKTWAALENYVPIMEPWGVLSITMTRWDLWDLPARLRARWNQDISEPPIHFKADNGDGVSLIPELYTHEQLASYRRMMGPFRYAAQFVLDPVAPEEQRFPETFYRELKIPRDKMKWVAVSLDPAPVNAGDGSESALVIGGWLEGGHYHQLDFESGRWREDYVVEKVMEKCRLWQPTYLVCERNSWSNWVRGALEIELRKLVQRPALVEVPCGSVSKAERIRAWVPDYKAGRCTFSPDMTQKDKWQGQMFRFHGGIRKMDGFDGLDSWAQLRHMSLGIVPQDRWVPRTEEDKRKYEFTEFQRCASLWRKGRSQELPWAVAGKSWSRF